MQGSQRWITDQVGGRDQGTDPGNSVILADKEDIDEHLPSDAGMSTVEYAVGTIAAAAFAAVLYKIVTGDSVISGLTSLVNSALHTSL